MYTVTASFQGLYKEKGSKFIAYLDPCQNETQAQNLRRQYQSSHHDARHVCFAYKVEGGKAHRSSDDGEPSGTAGRPIAGQIDSKELVNVMITVVRYFGGTKLGTGGLIKAYKLAAQDAISVATIVPYVEMVPGELTTNYASADKAIRVVEQCGGQITAKNFGAVCHLALTLPKEKIELLKKALPADITLSLT